MLCKTHISWVVLLTQLHSTRWKCWAQASVLIWWSLSLRIATLFLQRLQSMSFRTVMVQRWTLRLRESMSLQLFLWLRKQVSAVMRQGSASQLATWLQSSRFWSWEKTATSSLSESVSNLSAAVSNDHSNHFPTLCQSCRGLEHDWHNLCLCQWTTCYCLSCQRRRWETI